jgi:hypothetical protein
MVCRGQLVPIESAPKIGQNPAMPDEPDKPSLTLLMGEKIDAEAIRRLFVKLTGREPTPEEMEEARKVLERDCPESPAGEVAG